jgi:hypothetical protein
MKARATALEDPELGTSAKVEELEERIGLGDAQIITGQEPNATLTSDHVAQVFVKLSHAARHRERDRNIYLVCVVEVRDQVREERVVSAPDNGPIVRRSFDGG